MIYLVATEFIPEALDLGDGLPGKGYRELVGGFVVGGVFMLPLAFMGG